MKRRLFLHRSLPLLALPLAGATASSWRLLYVFPLLAIPTVPMVAWQVVESERSSLFIPGMGRDFLQRRYAQ